MIGWCFDVSEETPVGNFKRRDEYALKALFLVDGEFGRDRAASTPSRACKIEEVDFSCQSRHFTQFKNFNCNKQKFGVLFGMVGMTKLQN